MNIGKDLYQLVVEYADLGEHRTGTGVDRATVEWTSAQLRQRGGQVEFQTYEFDQYDAEWEVKFDGEAVQSIPLFYEGVGTVSSTDPAPMLWEPGLSHTGVDPAWQAFTETALAEGHQAAVVATGGAAGLLHAVNRRPVLGSGLPTLLVPGALGDRLGEAQIRVEIDARIIVSDSANVTARFGEGSTDELIVITTPLSGWFRCAGERGTGIAVAIAAASELSERFPVLFVGTTGHELHHQGAQKAIAELDGIPKAIIHIGASIAAAEAPLVDGEAELTKGLQARLAAESQRAEEVASRLAAIGIRTTIPDDPRDPDEWIGESKNWAFFERPMLSLAGGFYLFHAPEDVPERATTPALLARSHAAITAAIQALVQ